MSIILTDNEVNELLRLKKHFINLPISMPLENSKKSYRLTDDSNKERFELNIERKKIEITINKTKINHSYNNEPIIRIEIGAPPHTNPDFTIVGRNHIHIYKEGYAMRWAYNIEDFFPDLIENSSFDLIFEKFCVYCNIDIENVQLAMQYS